MSTLAFGTAFAVWAAQPPAATPANGITVLSLTPPEYPQLAMEHHLSGSVLLRVEVAPDGHVANAVVESAVPRGIFEEAAIAAVRTWRFQPAMKDGRPVAQQVRVPIRFAPREPGEDEARADAGTFDAAAYDWTKIDLSAPYVADVSCDVMKGNIADDIVDCGKLRN